MYYNSYFCIIQIDREPFKNVYTDINTIKTLKYYIFIQIESFIKKERLFCYCGIIYMSTFQFNFGGSG